MKIKSLIMCHCMKVTTVIRSQDPQHLFVHNVNTTTERSDLDLSIRLLRSATEFDVFVTAL